jgi:aryl-alcohol dehydrogenase-like predicted oxidoreductase
MAQTRPNMVRGEPCAIQKPRHARPNILLIPVTSSVGRLRENLAAVALTFSRESIATPDRIAADSQPGQDAA